MTIVEASKTCFKKYATFSGRASRAEFWKFILFMILVLIVLTIINSLIFGPTVIESVRSTVSASGEVQTARSIKYEYNSGVFGTVFTLAALLPWLAVGWRRMHDHNRPGYLPWLSLLVVVVGMFLAVGASIGFGLMFELLRTTGNVTVQSAGTGVLMLVLMLGAFLLNLYWLTRPSDPHTNKYGPNPHEVPQ